MASKKIEEKIDEILKAVERQDKVLTDLRTRFEDDFGKWRLEPFQEGKKGEYDNYTSNEPRNLVDKVTEKLATAPVQIRIPIDVDTEEERKAKSNAERFIYGAINLANSRLQNMIQPSIQEQLAFFATLRGWFALRAFIHKGKGGDVIPDIAIWDINHTTWDVGEDLLWVCHKRPITKETAKSEYGIDINGDSSLYDWWDDEINLAFINKEVVIKPQKHGCGHVPVLIGFVGSAPFISSTEYTDTIKNMGESILAANRDLYTPKNKLMTYYMTIVGQGVHNPIAVHSSGGRKTLEKSPYYKGSVVQLDTDKTEKIEPIFKPTMPGDVSALMGNLMRDINLGGIPPVAAGVQEFQLPYSAIHLLIDAASSALLPRQLAMEKAFNWMGRELLTQFAKGKFGKLRLHGRDGSNEAFDIKLEAKDIKGDWFPETKILPVLPEDMPAKYAMAQVAVVNELLSRETARDKILGVQDTDLETQKIIREKAMAMPPIMLRQIIAALIAEGRPDLAQIFVAELNKMAAGATETPRPRTPSEAPVQPQFATGMPQSVITPEEMGRRPGG